MTNLPNFPITGNLRDILATPVGGEIPTPPWTNAYVILTSNIETGVIVWDGSIYPRPPSVKATVDAVTGNLEITDGPIELLDDDPGLNVTGIQWRCQIKTSFNNVVTEFWFDAPGDGSTVNLATVAHVPAASVNQVAGLTVPSLLALIGDSSSSIHAAIAAIGGGGGSDEYHEYDNLAAFPNTGAADRVYVALDTGKFYRWTGSAYGQIGGLPVAVADVTGLQTVLDGKQPALTATTVKAAAYTAAVSELIPVDATTAPVPITLPSAPVDKARVVVKKIDASTNAVTIAAAGSDVFNKSGGSTSLTLLLTNQAIQLQYKASGALWYVVSTDVPLGGSDARYVQTKASSVPDAAGEWFCHPLATYQPVPYPRTVFGAVDSTGMVIVCERNHVTNTVKKVPLEASPADDHNVPAVWVKPGHRTVVMWTWHASDVIMRARVGDRSGRIDSLANTASQTFTSTGANISYTQIVYREAASTATIDAFWVLTRRSQHSWEIIPFTVNQLTGSITWGTEVPVFRAPGPGGVTTGTLGVDYHQLYLMMAHEYADKVNPAANQRLRIGLSPNPADRVGDGFDHAVWYFEIDCVTGQVTSPDNPTITTANVLTNTALPIILTSATPRVAETAASSRWLYGVRPGPDLVGLALAEWSNAAVDAGTYRVHEQSWAPPATNGLVPGVNGYASTPVPSTSSPLAPTTGMILTSDFCLPPAAAQVDVASRYDSAGGPFIIRILNTGAVAVQVATDVGTTTLTTTSTAFATRWGKRCMLRVAINPTNASYTFGAGVGSLAAARIGVWLSDDNGTTWAQLTGSPMTIPGSPTAMVTTTHTLRVPLFTNTGMAAFYSNRYMNRDGTALSYVDFEKSWVPGSSSYTDPQGYAWTLTSPAAVTWRGAPTWADKNYGNAGSRFGYNTVSNYLPALAFESPSYGKRVFVAASTGTVDTLTRYARKSDDTETATVLVSQPTTQGRIVRPYPPHAPDGPPPYDTTFNNVTHYGFGSFPNYGYLDYLMSSEIV